MLQEEFSAAEEDNEGDELWLSKFQRSAVHTEQDSNIQVSSEATFHCLLKWTTESLQQPSFGSTFINVITAFNNPITLELQPEGNQAVKYVAYSDI